MFIEVAFMPFAWTLTFSDDETHGAPIGTNVAGWFGYGVDEIVDVAVELKVGTGQTTGPGDYRDERTIRSALD